MDNESEVPIKKVNKQVYENSILPTMVAALHEVQGGEERPEPLFNDRDPNLAILHEKPEHRVIVFMKARGHSNREISRALGYTDAWVSQICRQPWFRDKLLREIENAGKDEITTLLEGAAADSILKLIELRDGESDVVPAAVQRQSCVDLLDRFLGKPMQRVESTATVKVDATDIEELNKQIAELEQQEKILLKRN